MAAGLVGTAWLEWHGLADLAPALGRKGPGAGDGDAIGPGSDGLGRWPEPTSRAIGGALSRAGATAAGPVGAAAAGVGLGAEA
jgi:hypothetical protein